MQKLYKDYCDGKLFLYFYRKVGYNKNVVFNYILDNWEEEKW